MQAAVVHQVTYTYRSGSERCLWLYGRDHQIYAPRAPWRWWLPLLLVLTVVGSILLVCGGLVWAFLVFAARKT